MDCRTNRHQVDLEILTRDRRLRRSYASEALDIGFDHPTKVVATIATPRMESKNGVRKEAGKVHFRTRCWVTSGKSMRGWRAKDARSHPLQWNELAVPRRHASDICTLLRGKRTCPRYPVCLLNPGQAPTGSAGAGAALRGAAIASFIGAQCLALHAFIKDLHVRKTQLPSGLIPEVVPMRRGHEDDACH